MSMRWMPVVFTDDLKKKRFINESFWLIGCLDVKLWWIKESNDKGKSPNEENGVLGLKLWELNTYFVRSARIIDIS